MSTVTVNGNTYSDDGTASRDLTNGGHRQHLLPMLADAVVDLAAKADLATTNGAAQVVLAAAQADAAEAAANSAALTADVTKWISGTTYAQGDVVWSPTDFKTYRRKTNGAGTTDPSADLTNWAQVLVKVNNPGDIVMAIARPSGWLPCDGAQYPSASYPDLAALLSNTAFLEDEYVTSSIGEMRAVAYNGSNLYAAVGVYGICTSPDGVTWTDRYLSGSTVYNITYGNGYFVATTVNGVITSTDGITWTYVYVAAQTFYGVAYGASKWVLCGASGVYASSGAIPTGFTVQTCTNYTGFKNLKFLNSNFCICGAHASGSVWYSTNGTSWSQAPCGPDAVNDIVYAASLWVIATNYASNCISTAATLGGAWTAKGTTNITSLVRILYAESTFVAVGTATSTNIPVYYSTNGGVSWTQVVTALTWGVLYGLMHDGATFWAGSSSSFAQFSSPDGVTWTKHIGVYPALPGIDYGSNRLDYVGGKGFWLGAAGYIAEYSGGVWSPRRSKYAIGPLIPIQSRGSARFPATDGTWLGVIGPAGIVMFTSDGVSWTASRVSTVTGAIYGVYFYGGLWLACTASGLYLSSDRSTWTQIHSSDAIGFATNGSNIFVTVGAAGATKYSATLSSGWADGTNTGVQTYDVVYFNGLFLTGTSAGYCFTSSDGASWTQRINGPASPYQLTVAGGYVYPSGAALYFTINGQDWPPLRFIGAQAPSSITNVVYGNGVWVLVGGANSYTRRSLWYSRDGINFVPAAVAPFISDPGYVTFYSNQFFCHTRNFLFVSSDGVNWSKYTAKAPDQATPILFNGKLILITVPGSSYAADSTKFAAPIIDQNGVPTYIKE